MSTGPWPLSVVESPFEVTRPGLAEPTYPMGAVSVERAALFSHSARAAGRDALQSVVWFTRRRRPSAM